MSPTKSQRARLGAIEVDQSGKIEQTHADTILAFSNGAQYSIRIPASVKRSVLGALEQKRKPSASKKAIPLRLFAAGLYLLLEDHLNTCDSIVIDAEYVGHEVDIRGMLLSLIWRSRPAFASDQINFGRVGKKSPAHDLAWSVTRGKRPANRLATEAELLDLLQITK